MRAQTALTVVGDIFEDLEEGGIVPLFQTLVAAMQNQVNSPNEQTQLEVGKSRDALLKTLKRSRFNNYPTSLFALVETMDVEHLLGERLRQSILRSFSGNEITPATALAQIEDLSSQVQTLYQTAEQYISSSEYFELLRDDLDENDHEISVVVPRGFVNNELDDFGKELVKLDKLFSVFVEIETGSREDFKIKTISSSDLTVVLESAPGVALLIAVSIERLAVFYERMLNIIKVHKELRQFDDLPASVGSEMQTYIDEKIAEGIQQATTEILAGKLQGIDAGRKNELQTELQNALGQLAKRLDSGFLFDIRAGEPAGPAEGEQETKAQKIDRERYDRISSARKKIQAMRIQSQPVLKLPKDSEDR